MAESQRLLGELKELENQRKNGTLDMRGFYLGLLNLLASLKDVLINEEISDGEIKKQIPLLLVFIKGQISNLSSRGS